MVDMTTSDDLKAATMRELTDAANAYAAIAESHDTARGNRDAAIRAAAAAGVPRTEIAKAARVSREMVYRVIGVLVALVAIFTVSACGGEEQEPASTEVEQTVVVTDVPQVPASTPDVAATTSTPAGTPAEVIQIGVDQVLRIDGQVAGRVNVRSFDTTDATAAIEVNPAVAMVIDPADFVLLDAAGVETRGELKVAEWDRDLAAGEQTMGPVVFPGAGAPVSVTYAPSGADPLAWSF
jgi:hypothetical protein